MFDVVKWRLMETAPSDVGAGAVEGGEQDPPEGQEGGDGGEPPRQQADSTTWRETIAGEDEKARARLERFATPQDFWKSYTEAENRIRSGELLKPLPKDATEEDVADFRKRWNAQNEENPIPETPEGYLENLPEGIVFNEADEAVFKEFAKAMHEQNVPASVVGQAAKFYDGLAQQQEEAQVQLDESNKDACEQALRDEWQGEYRKNINIVKGHLGAHYGEELAETVLHARDAEGKRLADNPEFMQGMMALARQTSPIHTLTGGETGDAASLIDRKAEIENMMGTQAYTKNPRVQEEYRNILEALDRAGEKV